MEIERLQDLQKPGLFEKFKMQLYRDYELCGFADLAPKLSTNNLEHVFQEVLNSVMMIERKDSSSVQNLLYRIDITELQIKREAANYPEKNFQQILAELIVKRILQKVILKEQYSK
ncbi:MAG: hypothetical protein HY062_15130 [Bacteroidetes bacterium]|nr:hypothetical protein [Bacteroidota bacterium]